MKYIFALILVLVASDIMSQKWKTTFKRFHKNKRLSTIEIWDKDRRNGQFYCMNSKGDTLAHFHLRRYAGHSSVWSEYYTNGQARKLEYSSAPDAGIQWYRETIYLDEKGIITQRFNQSHEDLISPSIRITK